MSVTFGSTTLALPSDEVPRGFASLNELKSFLATHAKGKSLASQRLIRHVRDAGDADLVLYGATRSGWCHWAVENLIAECAVSGLAFLTRHAVGQRLDLEGGYHLVSLLDTPGIADAINDIHRVFTWAEGHPDDLAELLPGYEVPPDYSPEQRSEHQAEIGKLMLDAVRDDVISVWPAWDVPYADDGTGPEYLFAFLRTLLVILQAARARGEVVVHIQDLPS